MKRLVVLTALLALVAFRSKPVQVIADRYKEWYVANGEKLKLKRTKGEITYTLTYLPAEMAALSEIKEKERISKKEAQKILESYSSTEEYNLKLSKEQVKNFLISESIDKEEYTEKQYYLISEVGHDILLINDQDTLLPMRCSFEDNYGAAPYLNLHVVFKRGKTPKQKKLIYYDVLFAEDSISYDLTHLTQLTVPKLY